MNRRSIASAIPRLFPMLLLGLAACFDSDPSGPDADGDLQIAGIYQSQDPDDADFFIEFNADGTTRFTDADGETCTAAVGTWTLSGNSLAVVYSENGGDTVSETLEARFEGGALVLSDTTGSQPFGRIERFPLCGHIGYSTGSVTVPTRETPLQAVGYADSTIGEAARQGHFEILYRDASDPQSPSLSIRLGVNVPPIQPGRYFVATERYLSQNIQYIFEIGYNPVWDGEEYYQPEWENGEGWIDIELLEENRIAGRIYAVLHRRGLAENESLVIDTPFSLSGSP